MITYMVVGLFGLFRNYWIRELHDIKVVRVHQHIENSFFVIDMVNFFNRHKNYCNAA